MITSVPPLDQLPVISLEPEPNVKVWCVKITEVMHHTCTPESYHSLNSLRNVFFKKENFTIQFLSSPELDTVNRFKAGKKQLEWMAGRFLIKQMAKANNDSITPLDAIEISHREKGAPFLADFEGLGISISHSGEYAAAATCTERDRDIGLDIEKIKSLPGTSFLNTAFTGKEIDGMIQTPFEVFKRWTLKEAYLKYIKMGFNESLHKVEVFDQEILHHSEPADVSCFSTTIDEKYVLSLVSGPAL
ncbi:MAG: 4'-phosphopantetheinyl transferase superfamily protein [Desulfobacteraceae bacterium]